jgi:hypothetical protein
VLLGIGLRIGSLVHTSGPEQVVKNSLPSTSSVPGAKAELVGQITGVVDCQWADPRTAVSDGDGVPLGQKFALASGYLEITYQSGARVILQGPCAYDVESKTGGFLSLGKLTARVGKKEAASGSKGERSANLSRSQGRMEPTVSLALRPSPGKSEIRNLKSEISNPQSPTLNPLFSIRTPTAVVNDLGTEFGVEVGKDQQAVVEVFQGRVSLVPSAGRDSHKEPMLVTAGQTVHLSADGSRMTGPPQPGSRFVRVGNLPTVVKQYRKELSYQRWRKYSEWLRRDPDLVVYYTFDNQAAAPERVLNWAKSAGGRHIGALGSGRPGTMPAWTSGRWPGKGALAFDGRKLNCVVVPHDQTLNLTQAITIAAWVKPDYPEQVSHLLNKVESGRTTYNFVWLGKSPALRPEQALYFDWGFGPRILNGALPTVSRWTHVAVSCDARRMTLYVDGQGTVLDWQPGMATVATNADVVIGKPSWSDSEAFTGLMDELAIFRRALSDEEIRRMAAIGKPEP